MYHDFNIPEREKCVICKLLHEINNKLTVMHRLAEKGFEREFEAEHTALEAYVDGYVDCMIYSGAGYYNWLYKRILTKINLSYWADWDVMQENRRADLRWARGY